MFKGVPYDFGKGADPLEVTLAEMDKWGIERAMIGIGGDTSRRALAEHPKRFIPCTQVDPNQGMDALRQMATAHDKYGIRAVSCFPAGLSPQVDINDKRFFPLYAKACELGIPFFVNAGVPGPRVPMHCQHVEHLDEVCWHFPELTLVTLPRLRAVAGPGGEADAQVAGSPLRDQRLRAQALSEGDHRLRQHARRGQDPVRRLLPDGPQPRAHHDRDAERALP